jgi:transposase InsO family protein
LTIPQAPNDVWTADFKGWFRTRDGQRVDPLTVRDLFSRFILGIRLLCHRHEPVRRCFQALFVRYGQPKVIRVDHGGPFAGDGALELSRLSAWWLRLGIRVEFTGRARPQDNGAHEQMHRIYKAEVASPPAANPPAQQWRTTRWIAYYNHHARTKGWGNSSPPLFTTAVVALIAGRCGRLSIHVVGSRAGSPPAVISAGTDGCEL